MGRGGRLPWSAAAALMLLLATCACAADDRGEICPSMDIRNNPSQMKRLQNCRVIEGQLRLVLMERGTYEQFENYTFPKLREVTGYIIMYRAKGIKNLGDLFPNLIVVRGMQLFKDFALVIFDNEHLEFIGLRSLTTIERGGVRIQHNDRLCYTETVDWSRIVSEGAENVIRSNYDTRLCGVCPNAQTRSLTEERQVQCPTDQNGRLLCWDDKHCQKICTSQCGTHGCLNNGTCCHPACLGGCSGTTEQDCYVCRSYSFDTGTSRKCVDSCPAGTYKLSRRCVTEQTCRTMSNHEEHCVGDPNYHRYAPKIDAYKIFNNTDCVYICPSGYMEEGTLLNATCKPCASSGCVRECTGGKIDSGAAAEQFRGCTIINGKLEIVLRTGGGNTLAVLENSLSEIREIRGSLQVTRSFPLVSLMFLKSLRKIVGTPDKDYNKKQVLHIMNNQNLELLWDWKKHGPVEISGGTLYVHMNPKLCYNQLLPLQNMTTNPKSEFTDIQVSAESNGNQASCMPDVLQLNVSVLCRSVVILTWNTYCPDDVRKLLGYSVYYIPTNDNVTVYGQRDACSDSWNVIDITIDEARNGTAMSEAAKTDAGITLQAEPEVAPPTPPAPHAPPSSIADVKFVNPCALQQPTFYALTQLSPYTRYAAYVKTYTTMQDKNGAQSSIIYFRTLPDKPSPPLALTVEHQNPHTVYIKWSKPTMPNGTIFQYHVEVKANSYNMPKILASNYCSGPTTLANLLNARMDDPAEALDKLADVRNGTCKEDPKPTRFDEHAEEERVESNVFENELQNTVYQKVDKPKVNSSSLSNITYIINNSRMKRSIPVEQLKSMLVKLTDTENPRPDSVYKNSTIRANCSHIEPNACIITDNKTGYVNSSFYDLSGDTLSLTVRNMQHYTWYTVSVWACRQKHPNETKTAYENYWCSERTFKNFRTLELLNVDVVSGLAAHMVASNKTQPEVNITWEPPTNPNGFVVAYNVHYSRIDDNNQNSDLIPLTCISSEEFENGGRGHVLRSLAPGNWSLRVTPVTVSGPGNVSAEAYIFIPERTAEAGYEWVWAVIGGGLVLLLVLAGAIWYLKRGLLSHGEANKLFATVNPEYASTVYVPDEWEVPRGSVEFVRELGQGSFGMVYEGIAKNIEKGRPETPCAVKTVNEHATERERTEFLKEASVMKAFDTFHVVRLLGVVSRGQPTLVVMELMEFGDLKTYLRSHRPDAEPDLPKHNSSAGPPSLQSILQMAIEIADGMAYLSAKKFVHRDLAARNCMVAGDLTVKVGDFGMTRDIYETDYYRKGSKGLLPVRWMSPESLKDGVFSSGSDVWSYGVVLWEMATLAMQPYQGLSNEQVVRYVVEGGVMERPEHCPDQLYELMRACWAHRAPARPSFLHLVSELAKYAPPHFRHRSFFHSVAGQDAYHYQRSALEEEHEEPVAVGAVATGSGVFGPSGRLASWVRDLSLRSRASEDAAAEPLQPLKGPNGVLRDD